MSLSSTKSPTICDPIANLGSIYNWAKGTSSNVLASDDSYATTSWIGAGFGASDQEVTLYDNLMISPSNNNATATLYTSTDTIEQHGTPTDKWGLTTTDLHPAAVNGFDWGVRFSIQNVAIGYSQYLYPYTYGFTLPANSRIVGVEVPIERSVAYNARTNTTTVRIDHIPMTVYYETNIYPQTRVANRIAQILLPLAPFLRGLFYRIESQTRTPGRVDLCTRFV